MKSKVVTIDVPFSREELNIVRNALVLALSHSGLSEDAKSAYRGVSAKFDRFHEAIKEVDQ